ncbi:MAG: FHA domain-containing protein [Bacteroidales bacterium]|nr:FHA domain-containing protein [Bacteroidales bacterium]
MKVYSIGREGGCDIVIHDNTDVISRRHAVLNVMPSGKMTITDQSQNGTYVNGIRITPNVPVPVTRKDNISLAHVAKLDWNMVPKTTTPLQYAIFALIAIGVLVAAIFIYNAYTKPEPEPTPAPVVAPVDSTAIKKKEQARIDSLKQVAEKAKQDSIEVAQKAAAEAKAGKKIKEKKAEEKKAEEKKTEEKKDSTKSRSDR